jgi:hypothetical protein
MAEAGASKKGLARRVQEVALRHGAHVGTTHVAVQRWLDGSGIQASTAAYVAEALSGKAGRRITPADLGFSTATITPLPVGTSYATSLGDALGILDGLTQVSPKEEPPNAELLADGEVNSAVLSWLVSRPDGLPTESTSTRRIGMRDVAAVRTAAEMFMRLDFLYGGGHAPRRYATTSATRCCRCSAAATAYVSVPRCSALPPRSRNSSPGRQTTAGTTTSPTATCSPRSG